MRVFLSYAHEPPENAAFVDRVRARLNAAGIETWIDIAAIKGGESWRKAIADGLMSCGQTIAFLSDRAVRPGGVCLDELGMGNLFDVVSDSDVVGARKPDRRIFDVTLAALERDAAHCWMIGDSPPNDIAAAAALGMKTCWMAPVGRSAVGITPTARVARFDQVPFVLAG